MFAKLKRAYRRPVTEPVTPWIARTRWADGTVTFEGTAFEWELEGTPASRAIFRGIKVRQAWGSVAPGLQDWAIAVACVLALAVQP